MALRTLKSVANNEDLGLTVSDIQITKYNDKQLNLIYKHDILYDGAIPENKKD